MKNTLVSVPAWCIFSLALMLFSDASDSQIRGGASGQTRGSQQGGRGVGTGMHGGTGDVGIGKGVGIGTWTTGTGPSNSSYDPTNNNIWDAMRVRAAGYVAETAWARKSR